MFRAYAIHFLKTNCALRAAVVLLVVATALLGVTEWRHNRWQWTAIDVPLNASGPVALQQTFVAQVPRQCQYSVRVYAHTLSSKLPKPGVSSPKEMQATISEQGRPIALLNLDITDVYNSARFNALPGHTYTVRVQGKALEESWKSLQPYLIVEVRYSIQEAYFYQRIGLEFIAALLVLASVSLLLVAVTQACRAWRRAKMLHTVPTAAC